MQCLMQGRCHMSKFEIRTAFVKWAECDCMRARQHAYTCSVYSLPFVAVKIRSKISAAPNAILDAFLEAGTHVQYEGFAGVIGALHMLCSTFHIRLTCLCHASTCFGSVWCTSIHEQALCVIESDPGPQLTPAGYGAFHLTSVQRRICVQ